MGKRRHAEVAQDEESKDANMDASVIKLEEPEEKVYSKKFHSNSANTALFKSTGSRIRNERISFSEASAIIKKNPNCGFKIVKERRHFSLPYHLMSGKIKEALEHICKLQLNKYRSSVGGAVIAVDFIGIKLVSKPRVIDDQPCFHCQAITPLVVFSPTHGQEFEATVTSTSERFMTALIYNVITVDIDKAKKIKINKPEIGDTITVFCECLQIKRGMCQMKGKFGKFLRKGTQEEIDAVTKQYDQSLSISKLSQSKRLYSDEGEH